MQCNCDSRVVIYERKTLIRLATGNGAYIAYTMPGIGCKNCGLHFVHRSFRLNADLSSVPCSDCHEVCQYYVTSRDPFSLKLPFGKWSIYEIGQPTDHDKDDAERQVLLRR